jgi:hypothetical protein
MLNTAAPEGDDEVDDLDPRVMNPAQRAAYRAALDRVIEEAESATE